MINTDVRALIDLRHLLGRLEQLAQDGVTVSLANSQHGLLVKAGGIERLIGWSQLRISTTAGRYIERALTELAPRK